MDRHKFVIALRKYLNLLVVPSPNLPDDDLVDEKVINAVCQFKNQWYQRVTTYPYDLDHLCEITVGLFE